MPFKFKRSVTEADEIKRALRKRVSDEAHNDLSEREIEARIVQYLTKNKRDTKPPLLPGNPIFSHTWREFVKDSKFYVGMLNGRTSTLEEKIRSSTKDAWGTLNDIQQEALVLDSLITEEEIKVYRNFTTVHFNSFARAIDMGLGFGNLSWTQDYKTERNFLPNQKSSVIPGTGLTLPLRERVLVPITDVKLLGEGTDVGDSRKPIVSTSPRNLLRKNEAFRHVIIRYEHDETGRKFKKNASRVTLLLELGNIQLVNFLLLKPLGHSTIAIDELTYINDAGEEVVLSADPIPSETNVRVLFEPIRTRYLKIRLRQYAPVTKTHYAVRDWRVKKLNEVLRGVGFSQLLPEGEEEIQGRVYDFSLEEVRVGLNIYEPTGVFRSRPIKIESPLGLTLSDKTAKVETVTDPGAYGQNLILPEGSVLNEYYAGVRLRDRNGNILLRDLIPVPDSYPIQREFLPLVGADGRFKLFPDLLWNLDKTYIDTIVPVEGGSSDYFEINTRAPHNFTVGEFVEIVGVGPQEHAFNGTYTAEVLSETKLKVDQPTDVTTYEITENTRPRAFFFAADLTDQASPLSVNENNLTLTIGTHYQVSIDDGATWLNEFPRGQDYIEALRLARSGRFRVKIIAPKLDRLYWTEYRPLKTQYLGNTKLVRLRNGRVVFHKSLIGSKGTVNTVIVSRSDTHNPYVSPIIQFYALKVREDVS